MASWRVAEAKAKLSAVLDRAESEGPQRVTRRKQEFYLVTKEQFAGTEAKLTATPFVSAWDAMRPSFDERFDVDFPRAQARTRRLDLE